MTMSMRRFLLLTLLTTATAQEAKKVLSKAHDLGHAAIEKELRVSFPQNNVESFTCTLTGATGQDTCDATTDDDGSKCVWCVLNGFGFCVSAEQAQTFEQAIPTIDCDDSADDDKPAPDDDKTPSDGPLWDCLESKDEGSCGDTCVWCNTKGGFGVCLTKEAADMASDSYWFECPKEDDEDDEEEEELVGEGESRDEEDADDDSEDADFYDDDEEEEMEDDDDEEEEDADGMHEFVVDTNCVLSGILLDPADDEATSEAACFQARDTEGNPCEWCAVAGSPFRLCLSEPQAQVAEYVGAVCTGSDESFEPEDFDDSCIAHQHNDLTLTKDGCWNHQDLDGNGCEWCNLMGVELCLGGVQAELVEHWGATCVLDTAEHEMAQAAIAQHQLYVKAQQEQERKKKLAQRIAEMGQANPEEPIVMEEEEEDEIDLASLWLTSDPSCMVTTLRTTNGEDNELACAQTQDADGNPCNWCEMGTGFSMCLNDEQANVAEYMGIGCETISTEAQDVLREHAQRTEEYEEEEEDEDEEDIEDFDPSCIMSMQNGPDQTTCVNTKDQDGQACEWCTWNQFQICLAAEQAQIVEPFGVKCDQVAPRPAPEDPQQMIALKELKARFEERPKLDTSCLVDAGQFNDPQKCTSSKDATEGKPCEWCTLGSLGINACMSAEQAELARPLGVTCQDEEPSVVPEGEDAPILQEIPDDFWSCLSQSSTLDNCDETCTWCDLKGSPSGAGLCLSDPIADAVTQLLGGEVLDCMEPEEEESTEEDVAAAEEEVDEETA